MIGYHVFIVETDLHQWCLAENAIIFALLPANELRFLGN